MINLIVMLDAKKKFEGDVMSVEVQTEDGIAKLLPDHQPYLAKVLSYAKYEISAGEQTKLEFSHGFVYIKGNTCFLICSID